MRILWQSLERTKRSETTCLLLRMAMTTSSGAQESMSQTNQPLGLFFYGANASRNPGGALPVKNSAVRVDDEV